MDVAKAAGWLDPEPQPWQLLRAAVRLLHELRREKRRMVNDRTFSSTWMSNNMGNGSLKQASRGRASVSVELACQLCLVFSIRKLLTAEMRLTTPSRPHPVGSRSWDSGRVGTEMLAWTTNINKDVWECRRRRMELVYVKRTHILLMKPSYRRGQWPVVPSKRRTALGSGRWLASNGYHGLGKSFIIGALIDARSSSASSNFKTAQVSQRIFSHWGRLEQVITGKNESMWDFLITEAIRGTTACNRKAVKYIFHLMTMFLQLPFAISVLFFLRICNSNWNMWQYSPRLAF